MQVSKSMCEQSANVTAPEVSQKFVARFADVAMLLALEENIEAASLGVSVGGPVPH